MSISTVLIVEAVIAIWCSIRASITMVEHCQKELHNDLSSNVAPNFIKFYRAKLSNINQCGSSDRLISNFAGDFYATYNTRFEYALRAWEF